MNLSFYRPNKTLAHGVALQFGRGNDRHGRPAVFIEAAKQFKEKQAPGSNEPIFDWDKKVVIKISIEEIGQLLAVAEGRSDAIPSFNSKIYHKDGENFKEISFSKHDNSGGYMFDISAGFIDAKKTTRTFKRFVIMSPGDAVILSKFLNLAATEYFKYERRSDRNLAELFYEAD